MNGYETGFLLRCAVSGVPKDAALGMLKKAESRLGHEYAGSMVSAMPFGIIPGAVGGLLGSLNARDLSDEELAELVKARGNLANYVPGVAEYRMAQRGGALANAEMELAKKLGIKTIRPTRHAATESLSLLNPLNIVGYPIGKLVGALGGHRTLEEQVRHDAAKQSLKNLLIPGYGAYQSSKRMSASRDVMERKDDGRKKDGDGGDKKKKDEKGSKDGD